MNLAASTPGAVNILVLISSVFLWLEVERVTAEGF